jgi:murein DD-endopeptidase MepM/ murein hydrolase activator NlpD
MKILFLGQNPRKPKTINNKIIFLILFLFLTINIGLSYFYVEYKIEKLNEQYINDVNPSGLVLSEVRLDYEKNLTVFIDQMGELYARIINLDSQTERLQGILRKQMVGKDKVPKLDEKKGSQGGPFKNDNLTSQDLQKAINNLMVKIEAREDLYNSMESALLKQSVLKDTLPSLKPVNIPYSSSSYGWRHDPILGVRAFHEGLDFSAAQGEQIRATASGIVIFAGKAPDYGNYVKIQHGNGLETRYAHCSKLLVKNGDLVSKGEVIALVGNTGRSTGPHLHYEIRLNGNSLDPRQYLKK